MASFSDSLSFETPAVLFYRTDEAVAWTKIIQPPQLPNCPQEDHDWNIKLVFQYNAIAFRQESEKDTLVVLYNPSQFELAGRGFWSSESDDIAHYTDESTRNDAAAEEKHPNWYIHLKTTGVPPTVRSLPKSTSHLPDPDEWPLSKALTNSPRESREILVKIIPSENVQRWTPRILAFLEKRTRWTANQELEAFFELELGMLEYEYSFAEELLKQLSIDASALTTRMEEGQLLIVITPSDKFPHDVDWERFLAEDMQIRFESSTFHKSMAWYANIVHGRGAKSVICAVLRNRLSKQDMTRLSRNVNDKDYKVIADWKDPAGERAKQTIKNARERNRRIATAEAEGKDARRLDTGVPLRALILADRELQQRTEAPMLDANALINDANVAQQQAVNNALCNQISLIHGLAGAGKSSAIAMVIEAFLRCDSTAKVLVCTPTNNAADEVCRILLARQEKVTHKFKISRVTSYNGSEKIIRKNNVNNGLRGVHIHEQGIAWAGRQPPEIAGVYLNASTQEYANRKLTSRNEVRVFEDQREHAYSAVIRSMQVVVCTCATAAWDVLSLYFRPHMILVDEAAMAKHYEIMFPIIAYPRATKLVLVGDPRQLQSVSISSAGDVHWHKSLFKKAISRANGGRKLSSALLNVNMRAHHRLVKHSSIVFYKGLLQAGRRFDPADEFLRKFRRTLPIKIQGGAQASKHRSPGVRPLAYIELNDFTHFIDIAYSYDDQDDNGSSHNWVQAAVIIDLIKILLETRRIVLQDILVLTPYRSQTTLLTRMASRAKWDVGHGALRISTVTAAQGQEANVVIFDLTRRGAGTATRGFLTKSNLINVATSRAKNVLFIIGHWSDFHPHPNSSRLNGVLSHLGSEVEKFALGPIYTPSRS